MLSPNLFHAAQAAGSTKDTDCFHTTFAVRRKAQRYQALLQGSPLLLGLWRSSLLHLLGLTLGAPGEPFIELGLFLLLPPLPREFGDLEEDLDRDLDVEREVRERERDRDRELERESEE